MSILNAEYWNSRYLNNQFGWDLGQISTPIKTYIDQLQQKDLKILIPGAGNAYEAIYLLENGFTNVTVIDLADKAIQNLSDKLAAINSKNYQLIQGDFFDHLGNYDLILEQTFFCAINPNLRANYVQHSHQLLFSNGKIAGLMFNKAFSFEGPPFSGYKEEYIKLFEERFKIEIMEDAYNSVLPRQGSELFVKMIKK